MFFTIIMLKLFILMLYISEHPLTVPFQQNTNHLKIFPANDLRSFASSIKVSSGATAQLTRSRVVCITLLIIFCNHPLWSILFYPISLPLGLTFFILVSFGHQQRSQDNCFQGSRYFNIVTRKLDTN